MSRLAEFFVLLLLIVLGTWGGNALAATYVSRATGNWNATGTWAELRTGTITTSTASTTVNGVGTTFTTQLAVGNVLYRVDGAAIGTVQTITNNTTLTLTANAASTNSGIPFYRGATATPVAGDTVTVNSPNTVTVSAAAASANLTVNSGGTLTQTASTLTLTGTLSVAGTHTCGNTVTVTGLTTVTGLLNITTTTGTKNFNGGVTISGGTFSNNTVAEPVTIGVDFINDGTFNSGTGTYTFNSAGQWGGGNPIAFGGAVAVSAARTNNTTASVTGTLTVSVGGLTNNGTLNTTGTFSIAAANTVTNNGTVTAAGAITGANATTSIWTNAANSTLNVAGAFLATGTLNASASVNTVNYNGAGAQAVKLASGGNYFHLTASGGNTKTPPAGTHNIGGNLTIGTGTTFNANTSDPTINVTGNVAINGIYTASNAGGSPLTIGGNLNLTGTFTGNASPVNLAGNFTDSGTYTSGTGLFTFNGTAAQTLDGTTAETAITNVTMNNTAAIANSKLTLNHDLRVTNLLTLTSGRIASSGSAKTIIPSGASISGASSNSFVSGRLQVNIPNGNNKTVNCPIGTEGATAPALGYSPASFLFSGVGGAGGELIAYAVLGDHPQIASSTLDATKSVNRYWVLTDVGVSGTAANLTAATMDTTFTFLNPADLDAGANTANFETERYDNLGVWNTPAPGIRTSTTTQALTVNNVGEFAVAEKKPVIPPPGDFNTFETSTAGGAVLGQIYTKLVGTNFSLDVVAILSGAQHVTFTDTVQVDLVTGSTGGLNCPGTPVAIAGTTQNVNLTTGRGATGNFNVASAYPNVRVRVRYPVVSPTVTSCSMDNFAIRPSAVTLTVSPVMAPPPSASATPAIKAGASFTLTATTSPAAGYAGTLTQDVSKLTAQTTTQDTTAQSGGTAGTLTPASLTANTPASNNASYTEVGYLYLAPGVFRDDSYTSVDQPAGCAATNSCDCVTDTTSDANLADTFVANKIGCSIGNKTAVSFGRFIPDHFDVSVNSNGTMAAACVSGGFTYTGQAMGYGTAPSLTIKPINAATGVIVTRNYQGVFQKLTAANVTITAPTADGTQNGLDGLTKTALTAAMLAGALTNSGGTLTYTLAAGDQYTYTRDANSLVGAYPSNIPLVVASVSDGEISAAGILPTLSPTGVSIRYGRLKLSNAHGSELLPLSIPAKAEYYASASAGFVTNSSDSCTSFVLTPITNSAPTSYQYGNLLINNALVNMTVNASTPAFTSNPINAGLSTIKLSAPGGGKNGSVDLTLTVPAWLQYGGLNPMGRATFGVYKGANEFIYMRENY